MNGPRGENSWTLLGSKTKDCCPGGSGAVTRYMAPCHVKSRRWSEGAEVTTTNP